MTERRPQSDMERDRREPTPGPDGRSLLQRAGSDIKVAQGMQNEVAAMLIEIRTDASIDGGEQLSERVNGTVRAALRHYGDRVRRIDVHLGDAGGNDTSHDDKRCSIEAHRDGCEPILVSHHESSLGQAIHGAVHKLEMAMDDAVGKDATAVQLRDNS